MTPLLSRIISEKKWWLGPLALLLVLNVLAYVLLVQPLTSASTGAGARATRAADARRAAERELAAAEADLNAQRQAQRDLHVFYDEVLPGSLASARGMTYTSLPAMAGEAGVSYRRRRNEVVAPERDGRLRRLTTVMEIQGSYRGIRELIETLEQAPEFIVIDDVRIAERSGNEPLSVVVTLSTYFLGNGDEP